MNKKHLVLFLCAALIVVIPFALNMAGDEGSDDIAVNEIQKSGYQQWFKPIWEPPSNEMESLLFTVQAAIGLIIIGGFVGYYRKKQNS